MIELMIILWQIVSFFCNLAQSSSEKIAGVCQSRRLTVSQARWTVEASRWNIRNSPEISRTTVSSCSVSSTLQQYVLLIITPGSTNISFIIPNLDIRTPSVTCSCTEQGHCGECRRKWRFTDNDLSLWRDPDDVPHCRIPSPDKTEWRLILATLCRWRCCFVADQLWVMTRIQEEEVERIQSTDS